MTVRIFDHDDAGYEGWLEVQENGYVVNTRRPPTQSYLKLHRADCHSITRLQRGYTTFTAGEYIKVCADGPRARQEIEDWARERDWTLETGCYCVTWEN